MESNKDTEYKQKLLMAMLGMPNQPNTNTKYTPTIPNQTEIKAKQDDFKILPTAPPKEKETTNFDNRKKAAKKKDEQKQMPTIGGEIKIGSNLKNSKDTNAKEEIKITPSNIFEESQYTPIELTHNKPQTTPFNEFINKSNAIAILQLPKVLPIDLEANRRYKVGKVRVYKNGKVMLCMNEQEYEIRKGVDPSMHQELAVIKNNMICTRSLEDSKYVGFVTL